MDSDAHEGTEAGALNTGAKGNEAGKPVTPDVDLDHDHGDREQVPDEDHDSVWDDAEVLDHTPDAPGPYGTPAT